MIEALFRFESVRTLQRQAPLYEERERYLSKLLDLGVSRQWLRTTASILVNVVKHLDLACLRAVTVEEIQHAAKRWQSDPQITITKAARRTSVKSFTNVAVRWLRFHNSVVSPAAPERAFDSHFTEFLEFLRTNEYSTSTIRSHQSRLQLFFLWARDQDKDLSTICFKDVEAYLAFCRLAGQKPRTIASMCASLRAFFRHAEKLAWTPLKISPGIRSPIFARYNHEPRGPEWKEVRRLLATNIGKSPMELRTRAMLFLFSIYGLRRSEVAHLSLRDFDWIAETFTVRRAKRGPVQKYPLQFEVGEAIIAYLRHGRPPCTCKNLFVRLRAPHLPINPQLISTIVTDQMKKLGIEAEHLGPHSLRHACATELLRKGSSLRDIADFLGHRDRTSASIYAKHDTKTLREVAAFKLAGIP